MRVFLSLFLSISSLSLSQAACAEDVSLRDVLTSLSKDTSEYKSVDKEKLKAELKTDFGATDEDMAFISSIRAARLPHDGFDFFKNPKELVQLCSLYLEAKEKWGKAITADFYDFFAEYSSNRITVLGKGNIVQYYKDFYQTDEAKKRFVLPH